MKCPKCDYIVADGAAFCTNCGQPLGGSPSTPGATAPMTPGQPGPASPPAPMPPPGPSGPQPGFAGQTQPATASGPGQPTPPPTPTPPPGPGPGPSPGMPMASLTSQTPQPGQAPPPYGAPPGATSEGGQTPVSTYLLGATIVMLLGAFSVLFADFGGVYWYDYYNGIEGRYWINVFGAAALIILPVFLVFMYMVYWSATAMRDTAKITVNKLDRWFKVSLAIGVLYILLGIIFAAVAIWDDYNDWWLDVGFYGGLIGGFVAAFFFYMARNQATAQGYPDGEEEPMVPYPLASQPPAGQQPPQYPPQQPPPQQQPQQPSQYPPQQQPPQQQPPQQQPPQQPPSQ
ncbi:MAG: zinc ribbon domain-containing protein [Thermoplasmata archaeon]|nr:MAG: zinc ribbon domain-containing protein [Thermoplasmata archaeon]